MVDHWAALEHPEIQKMLATLATKTSDRLESIHDADDLWQQTAEAIGTGRFGDALERVESHPGLLYGDIREFMVDFVKYEHGHHVKNESYEVRYKEGAYE
jgi:hypothetical protein